MSDGQVKVTVELVGTAPCGHELRLELELDHEPQVGGDILRGFQRRITGADRCPVCAAAARRSS